MNVFNILHKELWIHIILNIPCKYISNISNISRQFKDLCDHENLFYKQKRKGFPRKSGCFKYHDVTEYEGFLYNKYKALIKCNFSNIFRNSKPKNKTILKDISDSLLDLLYENNVDLICGDIINFGDVSEDFLFDGETIIDNKICCLGGNFYYIIPDDLSPIENNVPIKYWNKNGLLDILFTISITNVKNELIQNISTNSYQLAYTWFTLNNCTYVIYHKNLNLLTIDKLRKKDNIIVYLNTNHTNKEMYTFDIKDKIITNQYQISSLLF